MPTKLPVDARTDVAKKLWSVHQANEYKRVNEYKEGLCFNCFKYKAVGATIVDMCKECFDKRGSEAILTQITKEPKMHSLCFFCGKYKDWIVQYNVRLCQRCNKVVSTILRRWNEKGGMFGNDPFWLKMQKKHGHDWKLIFFGPEKTDL